jgi:hypothetical protein
MKIGSASNATVVNNVTTNLPPQKKVFPLLLAGKYPAVIKTCFFKPTKAGTGHYLDIMLEITEGEAKGAKLFHKFNIINKSERAMSIGQDQLNGALRSVGYFKGVNTLKNGKLFDIEGIKTLLIGKEVTATIKVEAGTNGFSDRNTITSFGKR